MLVWNGVVSIFVYNAVDSWQAGEAEWFLMISLILFVLIGLFLIFATGHTFLTIFNPRPTLTISTDRTPLESTLKLTWKFSGQTSSIRQLKIELVGTEEATYRQGTSSRTDREKFQTVTIADTANFLDITNGQASLTIPPGYDAQL